MVQSDPEIYLNRYLRIATLIHIVILTKLIETLVTSFSTVLLPRSLTRCTFSLAPHRYSITGYSRPLKSSPLFPATLLFPSSTSR